MTRKSQPPHIHYIATCGSCEAQFGMCGLPCFIVCPACQVRVIFWFDPKVPNQ